MQVMHKTFRIFARSSVISTLLVAQLLHGNPRNLLRFLFIRLTPKFGPIVEQPKERRFFATSSYLLAILLINQSQFIKITLQLLPLFELAESLLEQNTWEYTLVFVSKNKLEETLTSNIFPHVKCLPTWGPSHFLALLWPVSQLGLLVFDFILPLILHSLLPWLLNNSP